MPEEMSSKSALAVPARRSREVEAYAGPTPPQPNAHPRSVALVIWQRKLLVLFCMVLALGGGVFYLSRATPLYSSSSTLYVQQSVKRIVSEDLSAGTESTINLATQCELITSTAILNEAAQRPEMAQSPLMQRQENPVGFLKSVVKAEPSKQGELLVISVTSPKADDNPIIVNAIVQAYITYQNALHQGDAVQIAGILQKEVASHTADLKDAQAKMLKLRLDNPQLTTQVDRRDTSETLQSQLAKQLSDVQLRANNLHAALTAAEAAQGNLAKLRQVFVAYSLHDQLPASELPRLLDDYQREVAQLNHLLYDRHLGSANDEVLTTQGAMERTRGQMAQAAIQEAANCLDTIRGASAATDSQAQQLRDKFEAEQNSTQGLNAKAVEYGQWAATAERNERALEGLETRLKDVDFTKDVGPINISVLETAKPNHSPVSPIRSTILAESLVAGIMAGIAVALLADRLDQRLRSIEEITTLVDGSILGVIPRVVRRNVPGSVGRETFLLPRSATAEAFRTVRTAIYFGAGAIDEVSVKTIMVTSPTPGDGKSTCVSNLAIAVAQAGRRVLLIDADCRRPVQHKTFKVHESVGLTGVLTSKTNLSAAIRSTEVERLDLLPCGPLPHNPAELLDSQIMLDLLAEAARRYDQVLIDSPPVNLVSDGRILAASCDAAIMVLRAEQSTRRGATMAWNLLGSVGANRLGVVVNDVTRRTDGYYGYNYYGRYGYGPYHSTEPVVSDGAEATGDRLVSSPGPRVSAGSGETNGNLRG